MIFQGGDNCTKLDHYGIFIKAYYTYGPIVAANEDKEDLEIYQIPIYDGGEYFADWCLII